MNTPAKPPLKLSVRFLGPVISLDGDLASKRRNLIFARNGTGKSFLSRAFRCLDLHGQQKPITDAPKNLVSDESSDGKGSFFIKRGDNLLGQLQLDKKGNVVAATVGDVIFHVFSEDFVHEELREQRYEINGNIENEIAIDSSNIKLKDAQAKLEKAKFDEMAVHLAASVKLDKNKDEILIGAAAINKSLGEYKSLTLEAICGKYRNEPGTLSRKTQDICNELEGLKSIPTQPTYPQEVVLSQLLAFKTEGIAELLKRTTSPSTVADAIKRKISGNPDFFKSGAALVQNNTEGPCPFCEQSLSSSDSKSLIEAYLKYFSDAEEKHKEELRAAYKQLNQIAQALNDSEKQLLQQRAHYDALNKLFPSRKDEELEDPEQDLKSLRAAVDTLKEALNAKAENLSTLQVMPEDAFMPGVSSFRELVSQNNLFVSHLTQAVHNSDNERKKLQREACETFSSEFAKRAWGDIQALNGARAALKTAREELAEIEKASPSSKAKDRVADTFELLLKEFFANKYVFDKASFTLKRGETAMSKGIHRTLSDGEKSAIAFCYFVASVHAKVRSNEDYRKLFLVFDDPVTSMSYDYVFAIAQTLRNLAMSDEGVISLTSDKGDEKFFGPELLVLTHSSYFFNISVSNRVVDPSASFALHPDSANHKLASLNRYIAPFSEHLRDIWAISNGSRPPDHSTGNAIRSVLEAVGRFCRPDKSKDLAMYIQHLTGDCGITVKSVLINSMSHGTYYDEIPSPDDLKLACREVLFVVEKYAAGQIELVKA